jgi:hypothetical protein
MRRVVLVVLSMVAAITAPASSARGLGSQSLTVASKPGDYWFHGIGQSGLAVLTYGHIGCPEVDANGYCNGDGAWPYISGARWIWHAQNASAREASIGYTLDLTRDFRLPDTATQISGSITVDADNFFRLYLNGVFIGQGKTWQVPMTFPFVPAPGLNEIRILARNQGGPGGTPYNNPGGVIYRADISFTT